MFVKNTGPKVLGFGKLALTPGASDNLPTGFDEKHPVVAFYISKGWLTPTVTTPTPPQTPAGPTAEELAAQKAEQDRLDAEAEARRNADEQARKDAEAEANRKADEAAAQKATDLAAKIKAIPTNLEPLRTLATELGITFAPDDTRDTLKRKITEKYQAE